MITLSTSILSTTLVSGWLIGATAATAVPLSSYDVLLPYGDAAHADAQDRDKQREQAQREREKQREQAQREREQAQRQAERDREERQRQLEREREQRAREAEQRRMHRSALQEVEGERITRNFPVGREGSLLLHNVSGDIVVTAGSGSEIRVEAIKKAKGRSAYDAKQQLENVQLSIHGSGNRVEIMTEHRGRESRAWVEFNVVVPYDARVELHSVSGDITVTGVKGELRGETVSGDVRASALSRLVMLKSLSGDVEINGAESDGTITLSSVSGDVTATNLKARGIEVSSVSGDTVLSQCTCDRAQISSVSGSVQFGGRLAKTGRYELKTHSGDITLYHQNSAFDLAASTFSGGIRFEPAIPTTLKSVSPRYGPGRSVRGAVNGGGAYVELTTFSGDILVGTGGR